MPVLVVYPSPRRVKDVPDTLVQAHFVGERIGHVRVQKRVVRVPWRWKRTYTSGNIREKRSLLPLSSYFSSNTKTGLKCRLKHYRLKRLVPFYGVKPLSSRPDCSHFLLYRQFMSISGSFNDIPIERTGTRGPVEKDVANRTWSGRRALLLPRIVFLFRFVFSATLTDRVHDVRQVPNAQESN